MKVRKDFSEKPYNRCLVCKHRLNEKRCDGPRISGLPLDEWCEFVRDMKDINGLTNADVAEISKVSIKTVEKIMSLNIDHDIMRETSRLIEFAVMGSSNQYPCYLALEESSPEDRGKYRIALKDLEHALAENDEYKKRLDAIHDSYNDELNKVRTEAMEKNDHLLKQIERLRLEVDYLRIENDRKAKIIDKYLQ